ncbi:hypothetical protein H8L32_22975 [Undibacterium sp. CY18W]|uniref:Uncharacterized protein n=1 Tax=Undibacterium hunanense TaxID=2762292 RepID=A0ABR6ZWW3_9BURK|nr:hypothetical protein [Undibacterium hunanense]MBC3920345.1 hypothetical protein [Undibacterium hunanense]
MDMLHSVDDERNRPQAWNYIIAKSAPALRLHRWRATLYKKNLILISACCCLSIQVNAQNTPASSGDYFHDLGAIIFKTKSSDWIVELCTESFPETKDDNQIALNNWHQKYKAFIDEMNVQYNGLPEYWSHLDPRSAKAAAGTWPQVQNEMDQGKERVRKQLLGKDKATINTICKKLPAILQTDQMNIEKSNPNLVELIRRGPPKY